MRLNIVCLYVIVCLMLELQKVSSLIAWKNLEVQSICRDVTRKMQHHNQEYYETYWRPYMGIYKMQKQRINYRNRDYPTFHIEEKCCEGFKEVSNRCVPDCSPDCENGLCEAPNKCKCLLGYGVMTKDRHICSPICSNGCLNGVCVEPEACICSPHYFLDSDGYTCRPNCYDKCNLNNSYCSGPNICSCLTGYKKSNESDICEPICERECINGKCVEPELCSCNDDYELDVDDPFNCIPKCEQTCQFGTCTAPNVCTCNEGYEAINGSHCKPICSQSCIMGTCIEPDICICNQGYRIIEENDTTKNVLDNKNGSICVPICTDDCTNGNCVVSDLCICNEGNEENRCVNGICHLSCVNGTCTEPSVCTCFEGFYLQNETTCEPICESSCLNGTCVAPNTCQCDEGYFEIKNDNISVCTASCSRNCNGHGNCLDEQNSCNCYFGWTGWDCNEPSLCVYETTLDSTLLSSVTVMNETISTFTKSYDNAPLCYQCSDSLDKATLCFIVQSNESLTIPTVGCFFSTELPCYRRRHDNVLKNTTSIMELLIVVTLTIIVVAAITGYLIVRKHRKQATISTTNERTNSLSSYSNTLLEEDYLIEQ